ncbi:MAG: tetratricopeptide repeat protein [Candidatus Obscuribacterales bacterium]|nr:tetratricopeptide repeat protein [Candidatus Obscuribacterales bacterium]
MSAVGAAGLVAGLLFTVLRPCGDLTSSVPGIAYAANKVPIGIASPKELLKNGQVLELSGQSHKDEATTSFEDQLARAHAHFLIGQQWKARQFYMNAAKSGRGAERSIADAWSTLCEGQTEKASTLSLASISRNRRESLYLSASIAIAQKRFASALRTCQSLLKEAPEEFLGHALLCEIYLETGATSAATKSADTMIKTFPKSAYSYLCLSKALAAYRDYDKALDAATTGLKLYPASIELLAQEFYCKRNSSHPSSLAKALAPLNDSIKREQNNGYTHLLKAEALRQVKEVGLARKAYEDSVRAADKDPFLLLRAADFYLVEYGNIVRAKALLDTAAKLCPGSEILSICQANLAQQSLNRASAIKLLRDAKERSPHNLGLFLEEIKIQSDRAASQEVASLITRAGAVDPQNPLIGSLQADSKTITKIFDAGFDSFALRQARGLALANAGHHAQAEDDFAWSFACDPSSEENRLYELSDSALRHMPRLFDKTQALRPRPEHALTLGNYCWRVGAPDFNRTLNKGLQLCTTPSQYLRYINLFSWLQNFDKVESTARQGLKLDKTDDRLLLSLAEARERKGALSDAEKLTREAIALAPGRAEPRYLLGRILEKQDRSTEAEQSFKQALTMDPDNIGAIGQYVGFLHRQHRRQEAYNLSRSAYERCFGNSALLGVLIWQEESKAKKLALANALIELAPKSSEGYLVAFDYHRSGKAYTECRRLLDRMQTLQIGGNQKILREGALAIEDGKYAIAVTLLSAIANDQSVRSAALKERAYAFYKLHKLTDSIADLDQLIPLLAEDKSQLQRSFQTRGKLHFESNNYESAVRDFTESVKLTKFPGIDYVRRAEAYYKWGKLKEADDDLKRVLRLEPAYSKAHQLRSTVLRAMGKVEEAKKEEDRARLFAE